MKVRVDDGGDMEAEKDVGAGNVAKFVKLHSSQWLPHNAFLKYKSSVMKLWNISYVVSSTTVTLDEIEVISIEVKSMGDAVSGIVTVENDEVHDEIASVVIVA